MTKTQTGRTPTSIDSLGPKTPKRTARRSEVVSWESAAWALTGVAWVVAAWPGLLVSWDGFVVVPVVAIATMAIFVTWQVVRGATWSSPSTWAAWRTSQLNNHPPKSRRSLAIATTLDGLLWAGSGVAWCVAARQYNWSESFTAASIQMGIGFALIGWAGLGVLATRRIATSHDNPVVVKRRILGFGPMTVVGSDSEIESA